MRRALLIGLAVVAFWLMGAITWTENSDDTVVVQDNSVNLKLTFLNTERRVINSSVDGGNVWEFMNPDGTSLKPDLIDETGHTVDWRYMYWGDSNGTFVTNLGNTLSHSYGDKVRYNPTVIAKVDGSIVYMTVTTYENFDPSSPPTSAPSYTPKTTLNSALNSVLSGLALDNSTLDIGSIHCICGHVTSNCGGTTTQMDNECTCGNSGPPCPK